MKDNFYPIGLGQYLVAGMVHDIPALLKIFQTECPEQVKAGLKNESQP